MKDLVIKSDVATWFKKMKNGDRQAAPSLLREHYIGEVHYIGRTTLAISTFKNLFWKFPFQNSSQGNDRP